MGGWVGGTYLVGHEDQGGEEDGEEEKAHGGQEANVGEGEEEGLGGGRKGGWVDGWEGGGSNELL